MGKNKKNKIGIFLLFFLAIATSVFLVKKQAFPQSKKSFHPNIILITIDALRSDHLSCYGYKRSTSPNIDKLAKEGVLFTQAIAQSSHTPPSIGTIITSTFPAVHLLRGWGDALRPGLQTIAQVLESNGYRNICINQNNFLKGLGGFAKGFEICEDESGYTSVITNKALWFLREHIGQPFFLWVHYMDVHEYAPSKPYDKLYINDELYDKRKILPIVKNSFDWYGYKGIPESLAKKKGGVDNPDYYIAQYDAAIRTVDEQIGVLLDGLKQHKIDKKTLIIVTSDHGEMLGEHGYYFHHGCFLYEPLIKVPLIIKYAEVIPQNTVIATQVSAHLDIMPTILDILKIRKTETMQGESLLPAILGKGKYPSLYVYGDEGQTAKYIRTDEWKLICSNRDNKIEYELYNLRDDPGESNNLINVGKEELELLKPKLDAYKQVVEKAGFALEKETKERLGSLGYLH